MPEGKLQNPCINRIFVTKNKQGSGACGNNIQNNEWNCMYAEL